LLSIYDIFEFAALPCDHLPRGRPGGQRPSLPCFLKLEAGAHGPIPGKDRALPKSPRIAGGGACAL